MAETLISDVIVPAVFAPYVIERTAVLSEFVRSGVIGTDPTFDEKAQQGGITVAMPFWQDITGLSEILSDSVSLTPGKIGASQDIASMHNRGRAFGYNDLAGLLAGSDPAAAIGDLVASWWARDMEQLLLSEAAGIMGAASMSGATLDVSTAGAVDVDLNTINGVTFINAKQLLGDAKRKLVAIAMHSQAEAYLLKRDLIDFIPDSQGEGQIATFQGLRVIVDDNMTTGVNVNAYYDTYLFGEGAFGMGEDKVRMNAPLDGGFGTKAVELSRTALAGMSYMITRRKFILHPRGVKWTSAVQVKPTGPTNVEAANQANWIRVFEQKNVRIVRIRHNVL